MTGDELRQWRESKGLNMEQAGVNLAVPMKQWQRWESHPARPIPRSMADAIRLADKIEAYLKTPSTERGPAPGSPWNWTK